MEFKADNRFYYILSLKIIFVNTFCLIVVIKEEKAQHGFADAGFKLWLLPDKIAVALGILKGEHGAVGHLLQAAHRHVVGLHLLIGTFRVVGTENDGRMADADGGILLLHQRLVVKDEAGRRRVRRAPPPASGPAPCGDPPL